jgi:AcrR family transcriptional regulator
MQNRKRPLTRKRILGACVKYADKNGIDGLNMRTVAGILDAGVMSIYHHVANKDDLLDGMVELVAAEIKTPEQGQAWRPALLEIAVSAHKSFMKHPWVNALWSQRGPGPRKLAHMEAILRVLREGGFSVDQACRGYHAVTMHTLGFTLQALDFPIDSTNMKAAATGFLESADTEAIPYFVEHVQHHLENPEPSNEFVVMLDWILDGLERNLS